MYITLTTKCNMRCPHCCMSATTRGKNMSEEVFAACLEHLEDDCLLGTSVTLGGGEPTLHPKFEDWLWRIVRVFSERCEWALDDGLRAGVVTNGSQTEISIHLARMAKQGIIHAALSYDQWHAPIDPKVVKAFTKSTWDKENWETDLREIRKVELPVNVGRAKRTGVGVDRPGGNCCCAEFTVGPDGSIHPCGCRKAPVLCNILDPDWERIAWPWQADVQEGYAHARWADKKGKDTQDDGN